jgi:hypothetical protein
MIRRPRIGLFVASTAISISSTSTKSNGLSQLFRDIQSLFVSVWPSCLLALVYMCLASHFQDGELYEIETDLGKISRRQ